MDKSVGMMKFQRGLVSVLKYVLLVCAAFVALVPAGISSFQHFYP